MIIERILFNLVAFTLFIIFFVKMIKKNDTSYIDVLFIEFIGIAINFIGLIFGVKLNFVLYILMYMFSIIIPVVIIL